MDHLLVLRQKYGSVYITELQDGRLVPWKPLTLGEYINYDQQFRLGMYPPAFIENEIFDKCVLDDYLKQFKGEQKAGIVSNVVAGIMSISGPESIKDMNNMLNIKRFESSGVIHQIVEFIVRAFPSYKLEDIYTMNYETMMLRLAQAEAKMLELGIIAEPLSILNPNNQQPEQQKTPARQRPDTQKLLENFYAQQNINTNIPSAPQSNFGDKTIISEHDIQEHTAAYIGHEVGDRMVLEHQMVKDTAGIYSGYLEQMKKGDKVKIKTPEERRAEANARMAANKKMVQQIAKTKREQLEAETAKLSEQLKHRATRKRRR